jgi:hypothetical protein
MDAWLDGRRNVDLGAVCVLVVFLLLVAVLKPTKKTSLPDRSQTDGVT